MKRKPGKPLISERFAGIFKEARTDPLGSYTGTPADGQDIPTQDADDI